MPYTEKRDAVTFFPPLYVPLDRSATTITTLVPPSKGPTYSLKNNISPTYSKKKH